MIKNGELSKIIKQQIIELDLCNKVLENPNPRAKYIEDSARGCVPPNLDTHLSRFIYHYHFNKHNFDLSLNLPFSYAWWIVLMYPGQFLPVHVDPDNPAGKFIRYWIPLQDYIPGHMFVINNRLVTDYKSGDAYKMDDSEHYAANVSTVPRLTLQLMCL